MDAQLAAAVAAYVNGDRFNVSAKCRSLGVTTQTFYKYVKRFGAEGVAGFFPRSRRPLTSPTRLPAAMGDELVAIRKQEEGEGWDYGADAVLLRLQEQPQRWPSGRPLPSRSTVNRVFDDRGQLVKTPQRQPRPKPRRFARDKPNALWQFDGFNPPWRLGDRTLPNVLHINDDCSRLDIALEVAPENGEGIWDTFTVGVDRYGLPAQVLSDNAYAFSGRRRGWTSDFEANLAVLHVEAITSRPSHPQTCGKNERAHQRVLKWLRKRPAPADAAALQALLDTYREQYNHRRSQVLDGLTPAQRFELGPLASPDPDLTTRTRVSTHQITSSGVVSVDGAHVGVGRHHAGLEATVFLTGDHAVIFHDFTLLRELLIDRSVRYQRRTDLTWTPTTKSSAKS